jgi:hypothetical protein
MPSSTADGGTLRQRRPHAQKSSDAVCDLRCRRVDQHASLMTIRLLVVASASSCTLIQSDIMHETDGQCLQHDLRGKCSCVAASDKFCACGVTLPTSQRAAPLLTTVGIQSGKFFVVAQWTHRLPLGRDGIRPEQGMSICSGGSPSGAVVSPVLLVRIKYRT